MMPPGEPVPLRKREYRERVVEVEQRAESAEGRPAVEFMIDGEVHEARQRAAEPPSSRSRERA